MPLPLQTVISSNDVGAGTTPTVLVADDDLDIRILIRAYFGEAIEIVSEATDGRDALDAWRRLRADGTPIDVVLLDEMMPELTGSEVAAIIRQEDPDAKIVLFSASFPDHRTDDLARSLGVDAAVPKSALRELRHVVGTLVR